MHSFRLRITTPRQREEAEAAEFDSNNIEAVNGGHDGRSAFARRAGGGGHHGQHQEEEEEEEEETTELDARRRNGEVKTITDETSDLRLLKGSDCGWRGAAALTAHAVVGEHRMTRGTCSRGWLPGSKAGDKSAPKQLELGQKAERSWMSLAACVQLEVQSWLSANCVSNLQSAAARSTLACRPRAVVVVVGYRPRGLSSTGQASYAGADGQRAALVSRLSCGLRMRAVFEGCGLRLFIAALCALAALCEQAKGDDERAMHTHTYTPTNTKTKPYAPPSAAAAGVLAGT